MLSDIREQFPSLRQEVLSYAGVLDPMAEGWVPTLVGKEENRNRLRHTESIKEYVVRILVGIGTDSDDLMGIVEMDNQDLAISDQHTIANIVAKVEEFPPTYLQKISKFANKKYKSKPLWWYQLHQIDLPVAALVEREVKILDREVFGVEELPAELLVEEIGAMVEVFGDSFRMNRILPSWEEYFSKEGNGVNFYSLVKVRVVVSKGFFVRQWIQDLGVQLGIPMLVYDLKRTKVFGGEHL